MPKDTCKHKDLTALGGVTFWFGHPTIVVLFDDDRWKVFAGGTGPSGATLYVWDCSYPGARNECRTMSSLTLDEVIERLGCHPLMILKRKGHAEGHL